MCDQTSETGELIRSRHVGNAIPGNATICPSLQYLTFANAKTIRRGMHFFYTGFGLVRKGEQPYFSFTNVDGQAVFESNPDLTDPKGKAALQELTPQANIGRLTADDLDAILDPADPTNIAAAAANANLPVTLVPRVVVAPDKKFEGARIIDTSQLGNAPRLTKSNLKTLIRCVTEKDGKVRLHACKWTHQEVVVDAKISATNIKICLFSTAGGASGDGGTGLRVYNLSPTTASGRETRHLNVLLGFMHPTANENVAVLDASFLNPTVLKL